MPPTPAPEPKTSLQISILRPICILFMMSVHVNPGFGSTDFTGLMWVVGTVEVDILGRASVAALSLVSGFLLHMVQPRRTFLDDARGRIKTLYVPMVFWNTVFIALAMAALAVTGYATTTANAILASNPVSLVAERILFLYGEPASPALGFLRDLTVASLLVSAALNMPRLNIGWLLPFVLVAALFDLLEPVIYRPNILLFMTFGAWLWQRRNHLSVPRPLTYAALAGFAVLCAVELELVSLGVGPLEGPAGEAVNILKRAILAILGLDLCRWLAGKPIGGRIARLGDDVYLAFLSHTTVISALWAAWKLGVGGHTEAGYVVFFLVAPFVAIALAVVAHPLIDHLPGPVQVLVRGSKRRRPAGRSRLSLRRSLFKRA